MEPQLKRARSSAASLPPQATQLDDLAHKIQATSLLYAVQAIYRVRPELSGLAHVARLISDFADSGCDYWTLESVLAGADSGLSEAGAVRVLDCLRPHEGSNVVDNFLYERYRFNLQQASKTNKLQIVDWWLTKYLPRTDRSIDTTRQNAIDLNRIPVLGWMEQERLLPKPGYFMHCKHADTAFWLHARGYKLSMHVETEIDQGNHAFLEWLNGHKEISMRGMKRGIAIAARNNNVALAKWLMETYPDTNWHEPSFKEVTSCDFEMIKWLQTKFKWWDSKPARRLYSNDDWLYEPTSLHKEWVERCIKVAAGNGQFEIVKYLFDGIHKLNWDVLDRAAKSGHMEMVEWLSDRLPLFSDRAIEYAAQGGNFELVKWMHGKIKHLQREQDYDDVLEYGYQTGPYYSIDKAVEFGSLEMVKWLNEHRPNEFSEDAILQAVANRSLELVQFLHSKTPFGFPEQALQKAVRIGHLAMVQWLLERRSDYLNPIASELLESASEYGRMDIVKWLHESQSQMCAPKAVNRAAASGHLNIVKFLLANRSEGCTSSAVDSAASQGHLEIVKYILESGFASCSTYAVDSAALGGHFETVKYILESDFASCTSKAMDNAASCGHFHVVRWLHKHRTEGCTAEAVNNATAAGHVGIVRFLYLRYRLRCSQAAFNEAVNRNRFATVAWLMLHDPAFASYTYYGSLYDDYFDY